MPHRAVLLLVPTALTACTLDLQDSGKGSTTDEIEGKIALSLAFDGGEVATGSCTDFREVTTSARGEPASEEDPPACAAAVELFTGSCWGVHLPHALFSSLEVGQASEMLDPLWMEWSASDPQAISADTTDEWRGTMEIVEWGEDRRVIDLIDGIRRASGDDSTSVPTTGTLLIEGLAEASVTRGSNSHEATWRDVDTDESLCNSDLP